MNSSDLNNNLNRASSALVPLVVVPKVVPGPIELRWTDLCYDVDDRAGPARGLSLPGRKPKPGGPEQPRKGRKRLLSHLYGRVAVGTLTALIGPSGAGKTTLLKCISGQRTGFTGTVQVHGPSEALSRVRLSCTSHNDTVMKTLTVWESLIFASRLQNKGPRSASDSYHRQLVNDLVNRLGLEQCCNVRAGQCSSGQQKRLLIALELVHSPTILILDEPTSGLDSVSCHQTIQLLRELAENRLDPMGILVSIHQPTASLLRYFHQVYAMASHGRCLYHGPEDQLVPYLAAHELRCPNYHNPADFVVEIGIGSYGEAAIQRLAETASRPDPEAVAADQHQPPLAVASIGKIVKQSRRQQLNRPSHLLHAWLLLKRCLMLQIREPTEILLRVFATVGVLGLVWIMFHSSPMGDEDGCYTELADPVLDLFTAPNRTKDMETALEDTSGLLYDRLKMFHTDIFYNIAFLYFTVLYTTFSTMMPVLLTYPMEIQVVRREVSHGWYRLPVYFLAKNLANLMPTIVMTVAFSLGSYIITEQTTDELWRFGCFAGGLILVAMLGDGFGQLISAMFVENISVAIIMAAVSQVALGLFSGMFNAVEMLPALLRWGTYFSQFRLGLQFFILSLYGFDRCQTPSAGMFNMQTIRRYMADDTEEVIDCISQQTSLFGSNDDDDSSLSAKLEHIIKVVEPKQLSMPMHMFNYHEDSFLLVLMLMVLFNIVYRFFAYVALHFQAHRANRD